MRQIEDRGSEIVDQTHSALPTTRDWNRFSIFAVWSTELSQPTINQREMASVPCARLKSAMLCGSRPY